MSDNGDFERDFERDSRYNWESASNDDEFLADTSYQRAFPQDIGIHRVIPDVEAGSFLVHGRAWNAATLISAFPPDPYDSSRGPFYFSPVDGVVFFERPLGRFPLEFLKSGAPPLSHHQPWLAPVRLIFIEDFLDDRRVFSDSTS